MADTHVTDLTARVARAVARAVDLLIAEGDAESATRLREAVAIEEARRPTIVVVGEHNQGKSKLINALLGRPRLLPVHLAEASSVIVTIKHAPEDTARAFGPGLPDDGFPIAVSDIAQYAALDPDTGTARHADVTEVRVGVDAPLLAEGVTLVDTPGVGGLAAGHTGITLATLQRADALLFVTDVKAPITGPEQRFLVDAAERVPSVIFALTKIDSLPKEEWARILEADRKEIADVVRHLAGTERWFPVSADDRLDALRAEAGGDVLRAAQLATMSGVPDLEEELRERIVGRIRADRVGHALRAAAESLRLATDDARQRRAVVEGDSARRDELTRRRDMLAQQLRADAPWRRHLTLHLADLDARLREAIEFRVQNVSARAETAILRGGPDMPRMASKDLADSVRGLLIEMENLLFGQAVMISGAVSKELGIDGLYVMRFALPAEAWMSHPAAPLSPRGALTEVTRSADIQSFDDLRKAALRVTAWARPYIRAVAALPPGGQVAAVFGTVAVAAAGAWLVPKAVAARNRDEMRAHLDTCTARLRSELPGVLGEALTRLRAQLEEEVGRRIEQRVEELDEIIAASSTRTAPDDLARATREFDAALADIAELQKLVTREN